MKPTTPRRERCLSDVVADPILYPVTDELAGLERLVPEAPSAMERYAAFWNQRPALVPIRARADALAGELKRFIGLVRHSPGDIEPDLDICNALAILLNAANMTMLLSKPRNADDAWARGAFARTLRRQARRLKDDRFLGQVDRILRQDVAGSDHAPGRQADADEIGSFIARAAASFEAGPTAREAGEGEPAVLGLEQAASLNLWFEQGVDFDDLLAGVRELFAMILTWSGAWCATADTRQLTADAVAGARLLAFARLCRIGLWPARDADEVAVKVAARRLVASCMSEPDTMRAVVEAAFDQGEILAGQDDRFRTMPPA